MTVILILVVIRVVRVILIIMTSRHHIFTIPVATCLAKFSKSADVTFSEYFITSERKRVSVNPKRAIDREDYLRRLPC